MLCIWWLPDLLVLAPVNENESCSCLQASDLSGATGMVRHASGALRGQASDAAGMSMAKVRSSGVHCPAPTGLEIGGLATQTVCKQARTTPASAECHHEASSCGHGSP